jgi:cobalamin biosynthesis protein CobT
VDDAVLTRLREPGDGGFLPDDVGAVLAAYDESMSFIDKASAKIEQLEAELVQAQTEIAELKAVNYDLIMAQPASGDVNGSGDDASNDDGSDDEEPSIEKITEEIEKGDDK